MFEGLYCLQPVAVMSMSRSMRKTASDVAATAQTARQANRTASVESWLAVEVALKSRSVHWTASEDLQNLRSEMSELLSLAQASKAAFEGSQSAVATASVRSD